MAEDKKKEEIAVIDITEEYLKERIYEIRGQRVILDADLSEIYGYTTKAFNQQVKNNMEKFDESTKILNDWVRKQRNFVDGVQLLIEKLDELNKIRDYSEQFWKGTKEKMEEGVSIITQGSQTLNSQLTSLDRQFYNRLGATLAELDNCITKMVEHVNNRK